MKLKRAASILFASIMLISSGLVQFMVHVCPKDGTMFSASSCEAHAPVKSHACCDEVEKPLDKDDCCSDTYVFAVSPKFGGIGFLHMLPPVFSVIELPETAFNSMTIRESSILHYLHPPGPPLVGGRSILTAVCCLTI